MLENSVNKYKTPKNGGSGSLPQKKQRNSRSSSTPHNEGFEEAADRVIVSPSNFIRDGTTRYTNDEKTLSSKHRPKKKRPRASLDFPSAVIEMARRASSTKRPIAAVEKSADGKDVISTDRSSTADTEEAEGEVGYGGPHRRRLVAFY
uniref:Shugoshin C-terminal domain-containing protein n=1 Tax=Ascaris lumbricoides TaxID=6252 RepID=A0A0M3ISH5_ASCLU